MSNFQAIADTGKIIVKLLRENLTPEPIPKPEMIGLCAPYEESDLRLTVYLYSIMENGLSRDINSAELCLNLYYLITAFSKSELKSKAYDESFVIGKVMETMSLNSILKGSSLEGTLAENSEELKIILQPVSTDEMSKIWTFPNIPYKLSIAYMAGPVYISSDLSNTIVSKRVIR
ncbi:MAG TPA: DUF4255 domain-containing protein [Clostridia bacterium]